MDFRIGDIVKVIDEENSEDEHLIGMIGKVSDLNTKEGNYHVDFGKKIKQHYCRINDTTHAFFVRELEFVKKGKYKALKPDNMIRYLAYGVGCNNKSDFLKTPKELKNEMKKVTKDSDWTGRIIGYKLTPIFESKSEIKVSKFKLEGGKK